MNLKKTVLFISSVGTALIFVLRTISIPDICIEKPTSLFCYYTSESAYNLALFFPFILFFSLITYKLKTEIFTTWWKFARIAIPVIFLATFIISLGLHHSPGGWFNMDDAVDLFMLFCLYAIFIIGSLIQIYRGYRKQG